MGLVSQEEGTREYVRKKGSEAYAYIPSDLVLLDHDGYSVENEGIDVQAGRGRRPVYVRAMHALNTFFFRTNT